MAGKKAIVSINIVSDADNRGFKKAAAEAGNMAKRFGALVPKMAAVAAGASAVGGAIGAVALGAVALGAVATPALAAVALGFDGIKEAAGAAGESFSNLKSEVSSQFAETMTGPFQALGELVGELTPEMASLAHTTGEVLGGALQHIADTGGPAIRSLILASEQFTGSLGPGINMLIDGVLSIGPAIEGVAATFGAGVGDMLGQIGQAFSQLSSSGVITSIVYDMSAAFSSLGGLVGQLLVSLGQMGAAIAPALSPIFDALTTAVAAITPALTSMAGVVGEALAGAFQILAPALGPVADALASIVAAVAPLVPPLAQVAALAATTLAGAVSAIAPLLAQLAEVLAGALTSALTAITPLMPVIVNAFSMLVQALMPAIPPLAQIAQALMPALASIVAAVAPLIAQLAGVFAQVISALVPLLPPLAQVAQTLMPALASIVQIVAAVLSPLIGFIGTLAASLAGALAGALRAAIGLFQSVASTISTVVGWVNRLISAIASIRWPSPPSWLGSVLGEANPALSLMASSGDVQTIAYGRFAQAGPLGSIGQAGPTLAPPTVVNINVEGALDPRAVAEQIRGVLRADARTRGLTPAAGGESIWR